MIKIEGTFEGENSKELENSLKDLLKNFLVEGEITIRVKDIDIENNNLNRWNEYVARSNRREESRDIIEWSENNNSVIDEVMKRNEILKYLIEHWSSWERRRSVDMIEIIEDAIPYMYCVKDENCSFEMILRKIDNDEKLEVNYKSEELFKKDLIEVLNIYYERNPKFRIDW